MDRSFLSCLSEIEQSYLILPKSSRIRVERWVEKLVTTGNNITWKKHRNAYAKLLLNNVIARNLEDPFNVLPPEGPLPSFPAHMKFQSKNLLGPHESLFWRELYNKIQDESENSKFRNHELFSGRHSFELSEIDSNGSKNNDSKKISSTIMNQLPLSREIQNLNLLIKEQTHRIQLLEQQLHDERVKHELQIQRLQYSNRIENGKLISKLQNYSPDKANTSYNSISQSGSPLLSKHNNEFIKMPRTSSFPFKSSNNVNRSLSRDDCNLSNIHRSHEDEYNSTAATYNNNSNNDRYSSPVRDQKIDLSGDTKGKSVFDITPQYKQQQPLRSTEHDNDNYHDNSTVGGGSSSSEYYIGQINSKDISLSNRRAAAAVEVPDNSAWNNPNQHSSVSSQYNDDNYFVSSDAEFLKYIDQFQGEIKKYSNSIS